MWEVSCGLFHLKTVTTQQLRRNGGVLLLLLIARFAVDSFDLVGCMQEDLIGS